MPLRFVRNLISFTSLVIIFSTTLHSSFAQEASSTDITNDNEIKTTPVLPQPHKIFQVYHSMGQNKPFLPRGKVLFTILGEDYNNNKVVSTTIEHNDDCLGINALEDMDELIKEGGFYRIKIVEEGGDDVGRNGSVMASVPACEVRRANFR